MMFRGASWGPDKGTQKVLNGSLRSLNGILHERQVNGRDEVLHRDEDPQENVDEEVPLNTFKTRRS